MGVHYDILAVSQVTDVNGNWVQYNYDTNKRLQSITSSDGRRIDIGRTGIQIGTVTANHWHGRRYGSGPIPMAGRASPPGSRR